MNRYYFFIATIIVITVTVLNACRTLPEQKVSTPAPIKEKSVKIKSAPKASKKVISKNSEVKKSSVISTLQNNKQLLSQDSQVERPELTIAGKAQETPQKNGDDLKILNEGEIYIIGRIKLLPGLRNEERNIAGVKSPLPKDEILVYFSDRFLDVTDEKSAPVQKVDLDEHFLLKVKVRDKLYYSGSTVPLKLKTAYKADDKAEDHLHLPGDKVYMLSPDAKAVYLGTIRYYRNEKNIIDRVSYLDEFKKARTLLKEMTGNSELTLHRVKQVKEKGLW